MDFKKKGGPWDIILAYGFGNCRDAVSASPLPAEGCDCLDICTFHREAFTGSATTMEGTTRAEDYLFESVITS